METTFSLSYAISKQLASATAINTNYGDIPLDDEMRSALDAALRPILKRRLNGLLAKLPTEAVRIKLARQMLRSAIEFVRTASEEEG